MTYLLFFSLTTSLQVGAMEFWEKINDFYMSPIVRFVYHTVKILNLNSKPHLLPEIIEKLPIFLDILRPISRSLQLLTFSRFQGENDRC